MRGATPLIDQAARGFAIGAGACFCATTLTCKMASASALADGLEPRVRDFVGRCPDRENPTALGERHGGVYWGGRLLQRFGSEPSTHSYLGTLRCADGCAGLPK
jgi:hypothetical protein